VNRAGPPRHHVGPRIYDLMYANVRADVPYWVERARAARGPVLEVACGSGRVLGPVVAAGVDADGLDADPDMLAAARARIEGEGGRARLHHADMRDFTMPRRYRLIFIAFNSFLHNMTRDDQLATLRTCREHLEIDGALVLCMFVPDPRKLLEYDGTERLSDEYDRDGTAVRIWDSNLADLVAQTTHVKRRAEIRREGGEPERVAMAFAVRWIWPVEMELLLHVAGYPRFTVESRSGIREAFAPRAQLTTSDFMVWTAWKS
jgi:SAM-dependent methyltransferase